MSISFRADSYQPQVNNKRNVFSVSPNAQEVLSKTNEAQKKIKGILRSSFNLREKFYFSLYIYII